MTIAENIKRIRKEQGLTQKKLGQLCNPPISESTIRKYELGILKPKIETVDKIASALGVNIANIMEQFTITEWKNTSEYQRAEKRAQAWEGIIAMLADIYGKAEFKDVMGKYFSSNYYLIGEGENQFILYDGDIDTLYDSVKAMIPVLAERMKDDRPEEEIINEILKECSDQEAFDKISDKYKQ